MNKPVIVDVATYYSTFYVFFSKKKFYALLLTLPMLCCDLLKEFSLLFCVCVLLKRVNGKEIMRRYITSIKTLNMDEIYNNTRSEVFESVGSLSHSCHPWGDI